MAVGSKKCVARRTLEDGSGDLWIFPFESILMVCDQEAYISFLGALLNPLKRTTNMTVKRASNRTLNGVMNQAANNCSCRTGNRTTFQSWHIYTVD